MSLTDFDHRFLSRKEAAAYLCKKWFAITAGTLAKYASVGGGPEYYPSPSGKGGRVGYTKESLDAWATGRFGATQKKTAH